MFKAQKLIKTYKKLPLKSSAKKDLDKIISNCLFLYSHCGSFTLHSLRIQGVRAIRHQNDDKS